MNRDVKNMLERTFSIVAEKFQDKVLSWDRLVEFIAVNSDVTLIDQIGGKFGWLFGDKNFAKRVLESYDYQLLKSDYFDHLGLLYAEKVAPYVLSRSRSMQSPAEVVSLVRSAIPYTRDMISILDPHVGTGQTLMEAYKSAPNGVFFGVDPDIRMSRISMTNLALHNIRGFILCADPDIHEIDVAVENGRRNWNYANKWNDHTAKLLPKVAAADMGTVNASESATWTKTIRR